MVKISVIGISHKTAPINIREKFFIPEAKRQLLLSELKSDPSVVEALVLSTCNRTEIYIHDIRGNGQAAFDYLAKINNIKPSEMPDRYFYTYEGEEALRHLLKVASGLDSLILGEKQILCQLKFAIALSRSMGMMGKQFNIISNIVLQAAKKARTETKIDFGGISVSWAAVKKASEILGTLAGKSVLIIGTGKMGELAAGILQGKGIDKLYVMNRTQEKAETLAHKIQARAVPFWEIKNIMKDIDVCLCSAGAPHYLIEKDLIRQAMAGRTDRKLVCVDISVPRNIEPGIDSIPGVTLLTVDDLDQAISDNNEKRQLAVHQVEAIIERKIYECGQKLIKNESRSTDRVLNLEASSSVH